MEIALETWHRYSLPGTDLDGRRELARTTEAVEGVGVKTDPSSSLGNRDQIVSEHRFTHVSSLNRSCRSSYADRRASRSSSAIDSANQASPGVV